MAIMESTDNGKIIRETHGQMHFAARAYRFFAGCADKIFGDTIPLDQRDVFDFTRREPIGCSAISSAVIDLARNDKEQAMFSLAGKVAVVTGGGRGIGKGISLALAQAGATVICTGRTAAPLEATVAMIRKQGGRALVLDSDIAQPGAAQAIVDRGCRSSAGSTSGSTMQAAPRARTSVR